MIICWGQRLYGKVDVVPGLFHVATKFFYLQFIPLVPTASFVLLAGTNDEHGAQISMSLKSVLMAWLRVILLVAILGSVVLGTIGGAEYFSKPVRHSPELMVAGIVGTVISIALYWMTVRFTRASFDRALELAETLGIPREIIEQHFAQTNEPPQETNNWYESESDGQQLQ